MKMNKKKVLVSAVAVCIIAILSLGTLAWFNDTKSITNTFKVANSEDDTNPEFSVKVSETDLNGNETTTGVTYHNVIPGDDIAKNPTITNTGDYTQWIRVTVTLNKATGWKEAGGSLAFTDLFEGSSYGLVSNVGTDTTSKWLLVEDEVTVNDDKATWYLYLNRELPAGSDDSDEVLFTNVNIPTEFTQQEMAEINNEFDITVSADAVQRDNTGDNAVEAFANVNWPAGTAFVDED